MEDTTGTPMDKEPTPMAFTQDLYNEIQTKLDYLNNVVQEHKAHITGLKGIIAGLPSAKVEPKLPDAPSCNGDRKSELLLLAKCRMKFHGQPSLFPDKPTKIIYTGICLEGAPFAWFSPVNDKWVKDNNPPPELVTFETFATELTTLYRDPHITITAERKI